MKRKVLSTDELEQIVSHPWHKQDVIKRIRRYYCRPMQLRGHCTANCQDCAANLQGIILAVRAMEPDSPMGALVWAIRDRVAEIAEGGEHKNAAVARDSWGEPVGDNIFERLAKEYEKTT